MTPLLTDHGGAHGYVLSSAGAIAVLVGVRALKVNRFAPNVGVLVLSVLGMATGVIGSAAMLALLVGAGPVTSLDTAQFQALQPAAAGTQVKLSSLSVANGSSKAVVGNGGSVRLGGAYAVRSLESRPQIDVRLERRIADGSWTTSSVTTIAEGVPLTATTPPYSTSAATESVQYRFKSGDSVSTSVTVVYENQRFYTGMAATIYAYAAPYCPTTAVHVAALSGREAGMYETGASLILVDSKVGVTSNLEPATQRSVAVHECSHELQWLNYGSNKAGYEQMSAAAAVQFDEGSNGHPAIEHAADCGAMAAEPNGYFGYGGYCTPAQLRAAARLLDGGKY